MRFRDRTDAGQQLGAALQHLRAEQPVVVGLPRGGVVVAAEVARALDAPLDVVLVRKLGVPWHPELAMGAVGEGGVRVLDDALVARARVSAADVDRVQERETAELARRAQVLRGLAHRVPLAGRTVLVVDDGVATGSTALAACRVVHAAGAARVVVAVPVAPPESLAALRAAAEEVVCLVAPEDFGAVARWYGRFPSTAEAEVVRLLRG